jgi:hypothetical protein
MPDALANLKETKIIFQQTTLPVSEEIKSLFPTLLRNGAEGMPHISLKVDKEKG